MRISLSICDVIIRGQSGARAFLLLFAVLHLLIPELAAQSLTVQISQEPVEKLAADARDKGNVIRGAILQTQQRLACVVCHRVGDETLLGPDLSNLKEKLTDVEIVESLLLPSKKICKGFESTVLVTKDGRVISGRVVKQSENDIVIRQNSAKTHLLLHISKSSIEEMKTISASNMPEKLVDQLRNRQEFLDVVRYIMEIQTTNSIKTASAESGGQSISLPLQGLVLIKKYHCEACHRDDGPEVFQQAKQAPDLNWSAGRIDPDFITRFIQNPAAVKPRTTMPHMLSQVAPDDRRRIASELTHYIVSLSERRFVRQHVMIPEEAASGKELFHSVGCVACHSPHDENGKATLPNDSVALGSVGDKYSLDSLVDFLKDPHASRPSGNMPNMNLSHFEAVNISRYLTTSSQTNFSPFALDQSLVAVGKIHFNKFGCIQCHHDKDDEYPPSLSPLPELRSDQGCLSGDDGNWPKFALQQTEQEAIRAALKIESKSLSREDQINTTLTAFRCLNCHQRDDLGGITSDRNPHFQTTNPNLGPQGRIPPTLTKVGAKLNPTWMRQVLISGRSIRPYQLTRMPQYGANNIEHLIDLFQQTDSLIPVEHATFEDQKEMRKIGTELVGRDGLNCIACHTFQLKQSATMPAVDLTEMAERLKKDWFYHYMKSPQRLSPHTVMPSYFPGGNAIRKDVLDGDTDQQIESIWQYLLDGRQARQPKGLVIEPIELLATDDAVMLRRSYPEVGKRGIGVGYPHQVNLVFDAEHMRLAGIWEGKFADPGGVWRSQGHGRVRPLGRDVLLFAKGPDVDDQTDPWNLDEGRPPQHRFRGYSLDDHQRPTFRYEFNGMIIEDKFIDKVDEQSGKPFLDRTLTMTSNQPRSGVRIRLVSGSKISVTSAQDYSIDGKISVRSSPKASIETRDESETLEIRLDVPTGITTVTARYSW